MTNLYKILSYSTLGTFLAFIIQLISVKILSVSDYGVVAKWLTDLAFLSIFFVLGLDNSILFFSKKNNIEFNKNYIRNIKYFTLIALILTIMVLVVDIEIIYYLCLIFVCYCLAVIQSSNAYNQLNENFNKYGFINFLKNLIIFISVLYLFILGLRVDWNQYLIIYVGSIASTMLVVLLISKKLDLKLLFKKSNLTKDYYVYGFKSMLNSLLAIMLYSSTIYFLDYYKDKKSIAVFFAATVLSKLAWVVPDSVGNLLYPKFLKIGVIYSKEVIMQETFFYAQLNFLVNILGVIGFLIIGNFFIERIYGAEYLEMFWLVVILLIGNQGMVYYKILGRYLASINEWKIQKIALFFGVLSNVLFNFLLIPKFGLIGAALATSISFWICGIIMTINLEKVFFEFMNLRSFFIRLLKP